MSSPRPTASAAAGAVSRKGVSGDVFADVAPSANAGPSEPTPIRRHRRGSRRGGQLKAAEAPDLALNAGGTLTLEERVPEPTYAFGDVDALFRPVWQRRHLRPLGVVADGCSLRAEAGPRLERHPHSGATSGLQAAPQPEFRGEVLADTGLRVLAVPLRCRLSDRPVDGSPVI